MSLGETDEVLTCCNIRENSSEMIHFPGADSHAEGGMVKVLEWAHAHKDEKYCDPSENKELNMGHRLFNFVMSLFNSKKNVV